MIYCDNPKCGKAFEPTHLKLDNEKDWSAICPHCHKPTEMATVYFNKNEDLDYQGSGQRVTWRWVKGVQRHIEILKAKIKELEERLSS